MGREELVHRALASPVRVHLLRLLREVDRASDVEALARRLELHPNTVRSHLAVLGEAGLVVSERQRNNRPGRPRRVYRACVEADEALPEAPGYRLLAEVLAGRFASELPDPERAAEEAGRDWGRRLVAGPVPGERLGAAEALARLTDLLTRLGFDPAVTGAAAGGEVALEVRRCPFREVARHHPEVACAVHRGLTSGALAELGVDVRHHHLQPDPAAGRCVTTLEVRS